MRPNRKIKLVKATNTTTSWHSIPLLLFASLCLIIFTAATLPRYFQADNHAQPAPTNELIEPWTYHEDFEDRELGAWASYPLWQDIAYNQNFRVNEIVPGDSNISIVQKVTPYTAVDNYAGAQKLLDMYLVPGATLRLKYYLKTHQSCEWIKVRFAAGSYGKIDATLRELKTNQWQSIDLDFDDFARENPSIAGEKKIKIFAMALLAKFPEADPDMPIYLGIDDVEFRAARSMPFQFTTPAMYKLPEFKPYIPKMPYHVGSPFELTGSWSSEVTDISLSISPISDKKTEIFQSKLKWNGKTWALDPIQLDYPEGLYLGTLKAWVNDQPIGKTRFTVHISPKGIAQRHPRLLFDQEEKKNIAQRAAENRFQGVLKDIGTSAEKFREKIPPESLHFDLDQFPEEDWLHSWSAWGSKIYHTASALRINARAFSFLNDQEAGMYVKEVLLKLATWPNWTHPWQTKRGRYSEHRTGDWSHRVAEAYDLVYPLFTQEESKLVRSAIMKNIVQGAHRTYVYNDNITAATSNWLAMILGGSLMSMSAIYMDGDDVKNMEPYFTGALLKLNKFLNRVTDSDDGAWGEGFGYNNYSFSNLSYSLPSLENVFNIDLSKPLAGTYREYIWAGLIKKKRWFEYGDSGGDLKSANNWAYLLSKYQDPQLSWFYHFLRENKETKESTKPNYLDLVFDVLDIPEEDPFDKNPVKLFRDLGTVVFKSGWEADDFVFVMRSGPAYNHQHLDQGSFWLADQGQIFIEERPLYNSHYYDDPLYESWLTQPVGHSTILIDRNHQSQRVGDHLTFAPGFDDHAYVSHFLDGKNTSFATGDIGRLYYDKVEGLSRNVLYIKPRIVIMLDVVNPTEQDVDINLLYQTEQLADITPGVDLSRIKKGAQELKIHHLFPPKSTTEAIETPHYLKTLRSGKPLEREGMLTVNNKTSGVPLIISNLLTTAHDFDLNKIHYDGDAGYALGEVSGINFAFQTKLNTLFEVGDMKTDALIITWDGSTVFVAKARNFSNQVLEINSDQPITFELSSNGQIKYYVHEDTALRVGSKKRPSSIQLNGKDILGSYDPSSRDFKQLIPAGEGKIMVR